MNKDKVDKGFELLYDKLSYRRKFIRTICLMPIGIIIGFLITYISIFVSVVYWFCFIITLIRQLKYTYKMWKTEEKNK